MKKRTAWSVSLNVNQIEWCGFVVLSQRKVNVETSQTCAKIVCSLCKIVKQDPGLGRYAKSTSRAAYLCTLNAKRVILKADMDILLNRSGNPRISTHI